jgi:hypothetical protein
MAASTTATGLSPDLTARVTEDPLLLHHLSVTRDDPELFSLVLEAAGTGPAPPPEARTLAVNALRSLGAWVSTGLRMVPPEERERRLGICSACPHGRKQQMKGLYRLLSREPEELVCGLCGCIARRKAGLSSESCPDRSAGEGGRWSRSTPPGSVGR